MITLVKCIFRAPFQSWVQFDRYKVKIIKLLRVQRVKVMHNDLFPSAKLFSSRQMEALQFQAYCIICDEFATSVGKVCPCLCPMWIIFLEPISVFLWRGESWVWVVGGKLSSPFALNIKPLVLRFALRVRSEEHRVRRKGVRERDTDMRSTRQGVRWVILKLSRGAALQAQIRTIPKCHSSLEK